MTKYENFYKIIKNQLLSERKRKFYWTGHLSSSALAVSVAICALKLDNDVMHSASIEKGAKWLVNNRNSDGGYGDTPESVSNTSTTLLVFGALTLCGKNNEFAEVLERIEKYLLSQGIDIKRNAETSVLSHYGKDRTFSVPILTMLAVCGVIDNFNKIPQLPFELALLPRILFRFLKLQVVSYAIPALIAVGLVCFIHRPKGFSPLWYLRRLLINKSLKKLASLMPESGGYLEAVPLTSFVSLSLIHSGIKNIVTEGGISFLQNMQRKDGSFPIDSDLSNWVTTLSIKALGPDIELTSGDRELLRMRIIDLQYSDIHSCTGARPGGWGWTFSSGSVPDGDDTAGAILALLNLYDNSEKTANALLSGCDWLMEIQNRDGGIPTFCKGWGRLPFDMSCPDLTGHAFSAAALTLKTLNEKISPFRKRKYRLFLERALKYLKNSRHGTGYWLPLWFGNQYHENHSNPVYGTARIAVYLLDSLEAFSEDSYFHREVNNLIDQGLLYLASCQNDDGGWGGAREIPSSQEETALAVCALAERSTGPARSGIEWLMKDVSQNGIVSTPIGLYFASLWYDEKLYPIIFITEAMRRFITAEEAENSTPAYFSDK